MFSREGVDSAVVMDKPGVAFSDGVENVHSLTLLGSTIQPDSTGRRSLPAHMVVARYGDLYRFLKRGHLMVPTSTASPNITLSLPVNVYNVGDILKLVEPSAPITFAGTWAPEETISVTLAGILHTFPAGDTVLANIAANAATAINTHPMLSSLVKAIAAGAAVILFAKDGISTHALTVTEAAAAGTATASGSSLLPNNTPIGVIQSVNVASGVVTLTANATVALPAGANIGVPEDEMLGVYEQSIDMTNRERRVISPCNGCHGYYQQSLPHFDEDIRRKLDRMYFAFKF